MKNWLLILFLALGGCTMKNQKQIDVQGHRGARGLMPENTIPGFLLAADLGVTTLEMDVVISSDSQVVVSHEPYFSSELCLDPFGKEISRDTLINIYQMTYATISRYDCGSLAHSRFPEQQKMKVAKPLLSDVIDAVEKREGIPLLYNIELKSMASTDTIFHPKPDEFVGLVMELIERKGISERVTIQSFDFRVLQEMQQQYPEVSLAILIENDLPWEDNLDSLGFTPAIYSPYYRLLSREQVSNLQQAGMRVIPWTVNQETDINEVLSWGVDGIISDYPDRVLEIIK